MRLCKVCGLEKPYGDFYQTRRICKDCERLQPKLPATDIRACRTCKVEKTLALFGKNHRAPGGWTTECKTCLSVRDAKKRWGIENVYEFVSGKDCEICGTALIPKNNGFAIDHDHKCCSGTSSCGKCLRGLLCGNCNNGIGNFKDNPEIVAGAIVYLRKYT